MQKHIFSILGVAVIGLLVGCAEMVRQSPVRIPFAQVIPKHEIAPDFQKNPPRSVAILPFEIQQEKERTDAKSQMGQKILQQAFFNYFSTLGYADINPEEVEQALEKNGITVAALWQNPDWSRLGEILGADAVIRGRLSKIANFTGGVYSETVLSGELEMVDTRTGRQLWHAKHSESNRGGVLLNNNTVVDLVQGEVENSKQDRAFLNVAEEFSRHVVGTIPDVNLEKTDVKADSTKPAVATEKGTTLVVIPFDSSAKSKEEMAIYLRRRLISNLRQEGIGVVEPNQVDQMLREKNLSPIELAKQLGAQTLIQGKLTRLEKEYLVVHSQIVVEAEITVVDVASGAELSQYRRKQVRNAGLLKIPTGMVAAGVDPLLGMDDYYVFALANQLARDLAQPVVYLLKKQSQ